MLAGVGVRRRLGSTASLSGQRWQQWSLERQQYTTGDFMFDRGRAQFGDDRHGQWRRPVYDGNGANDITGGNGTDDTIHIDGPGTVRLDQSSDYIGNWSLDAGTTQRCAGALWARPRPGPLPLPPVQLSPARLGCHQSLPPIPLPLPVPERLLCGRPQFRRRHGRLHVR